MKIRPLPDIDLARIAPMPKDRQRKQLEQLRDGWPPFSYGPLRCCLHDIFNVQPELFGPVSATNWAVIDARLERKSRSSAELKANRHVARGLYDFAAKENMLGRAQEFFPLAMGAGRSVVYWLPIVLLRQGRPFVPFIDPRRSHPLTREARRFAFSMMHERIRAADPDYEAVQMAIFQFGEEAKGQRDPVMHTDEGVDLFSFSQMEAMVATTYELWREVCGEREIEMRRKATGTRGPLL